MKESFRNAPVSRGGPKVGLMAVCALLAVAAGMLAFGGTSEAQDSGGGAFLAREGTPPPGANLPCKPTRKPALRLCRGRSYRSAG